MLAVIETHPIQYRAPVYRLLQQKFNIPVTVIYGSDFSVAGYRDREFGASFAWDTDLLSGYTSVFLSRVAGGGARSFEEVTARGLDETLARLAPKAVLIVGYSPRFHQVAFYQAWRAKYPLIFRGETTDRAVKRDAIKSWLRDRALSWTYGQCRKLLYVGRYSYEHFQRLNCPEEKLIFSPYCVDIASFRVDELARSNLRQAMRRQFSIPEDGVVLLFSGKLSYRKGADLVLAAIEQLPPATRERIRVIFLGSGELQESLAKLARTESSVETIFVGFQNQTQLSPYYHGADLLVLPSRYGETWGLVVNEALHHGLPCVVSTGVGCAPDLIESGVTGEICTAGSSQSLGRSLELALTLIQRTEIRSACRRKVGSYTVERAAAGIARAYESIVEDE